MSRVKFHLDEADGQAVMESGCRFWFLPGRTVKVAGPWFRQGAGRRAKRVETKRYPDCIVFCPAIKVNKFTAILALPDGKKPKMHLEQVLIPDAVQEKVYEAICIKGTDELKEKYENNEPFFSTVTINQEGEDNGTD